MASYDLSHPIESEMCVYPGTPPVRVEPTATVESDGYRTSSIVMDSHAGSHIDAPAHMLADGATIDQLPVETFQFTARRVDCRPLDPRAEIGVETITAGLEEEGIQDTVDILIVQTGWDDHWGTDHYFDHPYLTAAAADWLADRELHLGIDALNVDPTPTDNAADEPRGYPVHHALFSSRRLLVENLRGLDRLPPRFELHAYPLAVHGGDAAPVRAVAVVSDASLTATN